MSIRPCATRSTPRRALCGSWLPCVVAWIGLGLSACSWATDPFPAQFVPTGSRTRNDGNVALAPLSDGAVLVCGPTTAQVLQPGAHGGEWGQEVIMNAVHVQPVVVSLADGRILVAGTISSSANAISAEIYRPDSGDFFPTGAMRVPRYAAHAVRLNTGEVLVVGGRRPGSVTTPLATAELYSPTTGQFRTTGSMAIGRASATLTLLRTGHVLITGGAGSDGQIQRSAEIYDPATGQFRSAGQMNHVRMQHAAQIMQDGRVLITGGWSSQYSSLRTIAEVEVFNPVAQTFTAMAPMLQMRQDHAMALLSDGRVLVVGGKDDFGGYLKTAELLDLNTGFFTTLSAQLNTARLRLAALSLGNDRVLIAGGESNAGYLASTELFMPLPLFADSLE